MVLLMVSSVVTAEDRKVSVSIVLLAVSSIDIVTCIGVHNFPDFERVKSIRDKENL